MKNVVGSKYDNPATITNNYSQTNHQPIGAYLHVELETNFKLSFENPNRSFPSLSPKEKLHGGGGGRSITNPPLLPLSCPFFWVSEYVYRSALNKKTLVAVRRGTTYTIKHI